MFAPNEDDLDRLPSPEISDDELKAPINGMPVWAERGRKLNGDDKLLVAAEGAEKAPGLRHAAEEISELTFRHHTVAKYLAAGMSAVEASAMSGYSPTVIRGFVGQPLFQELVAHYEQLEEARAAPVADALTVLGMQAAQRLSDRVERVGEVMDTGELRQIMSTALDRAGFSPKTRTESISVTMTGQELREIKDQANGSSRGVVIRQTPTSVTVEDVEP